MVKGAAAAAHKVRKHEGFGHGQLGQPAREHGGLASARFARYQQRLVVTRRRLWSRRRRRRRLGQLAPLPNSRRRRGRVDQRPFGRHVVVNRLDELFMHLIVRLGLGKSHVLAEGVFELLGTLLGGLNL